MATITDFRHEIRDLIIATFQTPDPLFETIYDGRLGRYLGEDAAYCGISPEGQPPRPGQTLDQDLVITVQFYLKFNKTRPINKKFVHDPGEIEDIVERFQNAVFAQIGQNSTAGRWFYNITAIDYPPDPVGQKSRAEVTLQARGINPALVETTV